MKYPYMVKVGNEYYPAGTEVPEVNEASGTEPVPKEEVKTPSAPKKRGRPSTKKE